MFGCISLTNLYDEDLMLLVLIFFNIDNLDISIPYVLSLEKIVFMSKLRSSKLILATI